MPTVYVEVKDHQAILDVSVSSVGGRSRQKYGALVDTGAQLTAISPGAAADVGLVAVGVRTIIPANGDPILTPNYRARLDIPIGSDLRGKNIDVAELPYQPSDYDLILGMDFLSSTHITLWREWFILSS